MIPTDKMSENGRKYKIMLEIHSKYAFQIIYQIKIENLLYEKKEYHSQDFVRFAPLLAVFVTNFR